MRQPGNVLGLEHRCIPASIVWRRGGEGRAGEEEGGGGGKGGGEMRRGREREGGGRRRRGRVKERLQLTI